MILPSLCFESSLAIRPGAASGIGAAISKTLAVRGAKVGMLDIDETAVNATAADMAAGGMDVIGIACDVARDAECEAAIHSITAHYGGIDILVNNAGITQRSALSIQR